jgi:pyruvate dehydrogenase E2 component (dihydrolipoamide acetyltransferase)
VSAQVAAPAPAPAAAAPATVSVENIFVPDIGGDNDVEVIEVHVKVGDVIKAEQSLLTLESDKAAMEVPSPKGGEIKALKVKVGDKVSKGSLILELAVAGAAGASAASIPAPVAAPAVAAAPAQSPVATVSTPAPAPAAAAPAASGSADVYAGPAVRKLARELGVDLTQVGGTGARGRIQKEDLHEFVKARLQAPVAVAPSAGGAGIPAIPDVDFSQFGSVEQIALSRLHKVTAVNMQRNWLNVPHVTQFNDADITDLEAFRADLKAEADKKGVKLTFLPFLLKACAKVLQEHKQFNVSLHSSGEYLIQKHYILLSEKAKNRRLSKEEMQGACFTISSLGALGGTGFTPIVNAPEVAILGVSKTQLKPIYINGQLQPRQMLPLALSYDHRAVNGVDGGMFITTLARLLGDIRLLVL